MKRADGILSDSGMFTRSEARKAIAEGRVFANGKKITSPSEKTDENAVITVDGKEINTEKYIYLMMNKPAGYVCENGGERSVLSLVPKEFYRKGLFTVGRLDKDTEGLLLITNDGDFAHSVVSPKKTSKSSILPNLKEKLWLRIQRLSQTGLSLKTARNSPPLFLKKARAKRRSLP